MKYRNDETDKVNIIESAIVEILFDSENCQMVFELDWCEGLPIKVVCEEVSNYSIDFENITEQGSDIGDIGIQGWSYIQNKDKWIIQFNIGFNPKGIIKISCSDFYFDVPSKPYSEGGNDNLITDFLFDNIVVPRNSRQGYLMLYQLKFDSTMWNTNIVFKNKTKRIEILCEECFNNKYKINGLVNSTFCINESEIKNLKESFNQQKELNLIGLSNNSISLNCTKLEIKEKYN